MNDVLHEVEICAGRHRIKEVARNGFAAVREVIKSDRCLGGGHQWGHIRYGSAQSLMLPEDRPKQRAVPSSDVDNPIENAELIHLKKSRNAHLTDAGHRIIEDFGLVGVFRLRDPIEERLALHGVEGGCAGFDASLQFAIKAQVKRIRDPFNRGGKRAGRSSTKKLSSGRELESPRGFTRDNLAHLKHAQKA